MHGTPGCDRGLGFVLALGQALPSREPLASQLCMLLVASLQNATFRTGPAWTFGFAVRQQPQRLILFI